jgi:hypothetical protein
MKPQFSQRDGLEPTTGPQIKCMAVVNRLNVVRLKKVSIFRYIDLCPTANPGVIMCEMVFVMFANANHGQRPRNCHLILNSWRFKPQGLPADSVDAGTMECWKNGIMGKENR